jgi:P4 family phage/plasmid primase-like protien
MNGIIPSTSAYIDLNDFLRQHIVSKDDKNTEKTNTRIGKQKDKQIEIYGGSYHISDTEYPIFLQLYHNHVLSKDKKEYLTEKQLTDNGPIVMDIDFRHDISVDERQYSIEHIEDFVDKLTEHLNKMYIFDKNSEFRIVIFEKPSVNRVIDKSITKDGVHIMIWIKKKNLFIQQYLRERMLGELPDMWGDLQIKNSWDDVLDDRVSRGEANWQLIGSRKPDHERYKVSHVYKIKFDESDGELFRENVKLTKQFIKENLENLSVRCKKHPSFLPKDTFLQDFQEYEELNTSQKIVRVPSSNNKSLRNTNDRHLLSQIQSQDELDYLVECFLDKNKNSVLDYHYNTIYEYTMILPETYYGNGSYDKWIRVGWVLFNISVVDAKEIDKLLIVWLKFSSQSSSFNYSDIPDICDKWHSFDIKQHNNLTKLSLYHWAKIENPDYYNSVRMNNIDYYVEETIRMTAPAGKGNTKSGCGDFDLARVLYHMFKDEYVCTSIKSGVWYQYKNNRWSEIDQGVTLRKHISTSLRELYAAKGQTSIPVITRDDDEAEVNVDTDTDAEKDYKDRTKRTLQIAILLTQTKNKNNIMIEAKELFYDGEFMAKLDINPYLLCFNNGVYDFKEKTFRKGKPEDNISMCTNIDYVDINKNSVYNRKSMKAMVDEIHEFMNQLFPVPELCKYMWQHLASALMGTSTNQTFNMYIGVGQNGKSVLVNLMEKVLGNYKVDVPLSLVTDKRGKIGGVTPEIIGLKGKRYAVLQEPSKDDILNEGVMKQLTSGKDQIQGRAPYMLATVSFIPQFKLVVTCNNLMKVNSTDHGTWRRIRAVPFLSLFTDKPKPGDFEKPYQFKLNKTIDEKFDEWKEVFAAMLIEECIKTDGIVEDCDLVLEKSRDYQKSQDYISEFIEDRVIKEEGGKVSKLDINNEFNTWYMSNYGGKGPSTKDLHEYMNTKYGKAVRGRWMNINIRKVYSEHTEEHNINEYNDDIDVNAL